MLDGLKFQNVPVGIIKAVAAVPLQNIVISVENLHIPTAVFVVHGAALALQIVIIATGQAESRLSDGQNFCHHTDVLIPDLGGKGDAVIREQAAAVGPVPGSHDAEIQGGLLTDP